MSKMRISLSFHPYLTRSTEMVYIKLYIVGWVFVGIIGVFDGFDHENRMSETVSVSQSVEASVVQFVSQSQSVRLNH